MSITRNKRRVAVAAVVVAAVIAVGIGVAAWSVGGSGNGYAKATTASSLTLADATAFTTAALYPGATGDLKLRLTNPNSFPVRVTAVSGNGTITSDKGAACDASTGVSFANQSGLTLDVGAGATATLTVPSSVSMSNSSDNTCQGAVFTVPVTVTGVSNA
ncbi:MAG TPA: hypothetical protein VNB46_00435 [Gaiellaceae bacterium]|jgi:hypothetical protein|nr:hypothetical protein [Gaiellaceae bacterium]